MTAKIGNGPVSEWPTIRPERGVLLSTAPFLDGDPLARNPTYQKLRQRWLEQPRSCATASEGVCGGLILSMEEGAGPQGTLNSDLM